jgi:hypothetical protein
MTIINVVNPTTYHHNWAWICNPFLARLVVMVVVAVAVAVVIKLGITTLLAATTFAHG